MTQTCTVTGGSTVSTAVDTRGGYGLLIFAPSSASGAIMLDVAATPTGPWHHLNEVGGQAFIVCSGGAQPAPVRPARRSPGSGRPSRKP